MGVVPYAREGFGGFNVSVGVAAEAGY